MRTYQIIRENDATDSFEVEADSLEAAAISALEELGWLLIEPETKTEN